MGDVILVMSGRHSRVLRREAAGRPGRDWPFYPIVVSNLPGLPLIDDDVQVSAR
jgi:hypothetical protein